MNKNTDVRVAAVKAGVRLYEIAEKMGMNDGNFSRMLRKELSSQKKSEILSIISDIQAGRR